MEPKLEGHYSDRLSPLAVWLSKVREEGNEFLGYTTQGRVGTSMQTIPHVDHIDVFWSRVQKEQGHGPLRRVYCVTQTYEQANAHIDQVAAELNQRAEEEEEEKDAGRVGCKKRMVNK